MVDPRHIDLLLGNVDLKRRQCQLANRRQGFDGADVPAMSGVLSPYLKVPLVGQAALQLSTPQIRFLDLEPAGDNPVDENSLDR